MHSGRSKLGQTPSPQTKVPHVVLQIQAYTQGSLINFYVNKVDEMLFDAPFFDKKIR